MHDKWTCFFYGVSGTTAVYVLYECGRILSMSYVR